ncbi:hypothetical protein DVH24_002368 [Malus domestica]|uniref:NAC domain-containing protein n=1 Tax=Malus domestica TaxID=3750 RepID=A0A498I6I1_MALDO|nr:hypothetical protein DVH24_002368 [Malus domestica]
MDEELVAYHLDRNINGRTIELEIIPKVDLYKCEQWDLPGMHLILFCLICKMEEYFMDLTTSLLILITDVAG